MTKSAVRKRHLKKKDIILYKYNKKLRKRAKGNNGGFPFREIATASQTMLRNDIILRKRSRKDKTGKIKKYD